MSRLTSELNSDKIKQYETTIVNIKTELPSLEVNKIELKEEMVADPVLIENIVIIKNEDSDYLNNRVPTYKTTVNVNGNQLKYCLNDEIEQFGIPVLSSIETHYNKIDDTVKIKDEIVVASDIYNEYANKYLSCDYCNEDYQDYCIKCRMLVHIFSRNSSNNRAMEEIPKNILEIKESFQNFGIFTSKVIPEGVRFGPFTGANTSKYSWRLKGGRFIISEDKSKFLNWMQYINPAQDIRERNLVVFQYEGNIFYRSVREINKDEELLVYFGEEYVESSKNCVEVDFVPPIETNIEDVFACSFCCLGFNSMVSLVKHKTICPNGTVENVSNEEIIQCPHCKIYLEQREYLEYHTIYCNEKNSGQCILSTPKDQTIITSPKDTHELHATSAHADVKQKEVLRCFLCEYETGIKLHLKVHLEANHVRDGMYSCTKCTYETKHKSNLKVHFDAHESVKRYKCSRCDYATHSRLYLKRHLDTHETAKRFKCPECDYMAYYQESLRSHFREHETAERLKCSKCDYATNNRCHLKVHLDTHEAAMRFKCSQCGYATNQVHLFKEHSYKHEDAKRFECTECDYATNRRSSLNRHSSKHDTVKQFKCTKCDYATHTRLYFRRHWDTHELEKQFKCSRCDYATTRKCNLDAHVFTHETVKRFRCTQCDYASNQKHCLKEHSYKHNKVKKHLDEHATVEQSKHQDTHETVKRFKCSDCDYATDEEDRLEEHSDTHETAQQFKCSKCDYATARKYNLKRHSYKHGSIKRFKCSKCGLKTNYKSCLKVHMCKPVIGK